MKPIVISGYFGFNNCGDEAILSAMIQELSKYIPRKKIIVLSKNPSQTKALYQVEAISRLNPFLIIYDIMRASFFISGGGGLLQDSSGKGYSIFYYGGLLYLAQLLRIPSVIYAQGIGPIHKTINKNFLKIVLRKVQLIMVRDEQSRKILKELGVKDHLITVSADPSFLLKVKEIPDWIKKKYHLNHTETSSTQMNIGIVIRNCREIQQDYHHKIMQFAEIGDYLIEKYQASLFFIPFHYDYDHTLIRGIIEKMKYSSLVNYIGEDLCPSHTLSIYSKLHLIIGMRFHSIVFATLISKPFIAIDYDPKVKNFVSALELPELLVELNRLSVKIIDNKLQYIMTNRKNILSILNEKKIQFEQKAITSAQQFQKLFMEKYPD
ncbi:MAG: polysaccharide pyruvyl transferase CsaB [Candidatus Atribacteria bacterium]|nr:polysaccharide pyruvyl transferase CsaB [Candidatus Atribacteria bacterium]